MSTSSPSAGPPPRPCRGTTAATLASFWTSPLSRWRKWIQRCLHFRLATASGTYSWETRLFRMMTGSIQTLCSLCKTAQGYSWRLRLCCLCMHHLLLCSNLPGYLNHFFKQVWYYSAVSSGCFLLVTMQYPLCLEQLYLLLANKCFRPRCIDRTMPIVTVEWGESLVFATTMRVQSTKKLLCLPVW